MKLVLQSEIIHTKEEDFDGFVHVQDASIVLCEYSDLSPKHTTLEELKTQIISTINTSVKQGKAIQHIVYQVYSHFQLSCLTIGVLDGHVFSLANKGGGVIWIKRNQKSGVILSPDQSMKGKIDQGDIFFAASARFHQHVPSHIQQTFLKDISTLATGVTEYLHQNKIKAVAVLILADEGNDTVHPYTNKLHTKIVSAARQKISAIKKWILQESTIEEEHPQNVKKKRMLLTIAIILIILLVTSIFFNINYSRNEKIQQKLSESLTLISHQYDEATSLIDLNPIRARTLLSDSKLTLGQLIKEFPKNSDEYKLLAEWVNKVSEREVEAYKIYKITQEPVFFDLTLVKNNGEASRIAAYQQSKALLDTKNKTIYNLITTTKESGIIAGSETVGNAASITIHGKKIYVMNTEGIIGIDTQSKKAQKLVSADEKWGEIVDISAFGGNLYLLDRKNNQIWKYIATDEGFSKITNYLNSDVHVDLSNSTRLIVDGSVWVLGKGGDISKFNKGLLESFSYSGFSEALDTVSAFSTSDVDKYVYILDKGGSRVIVFDKEGVYQSQYQWDELQNASDLVASEDEKRIFVLNGSKIYALDMK